MGALSGPSPIARNGQVTVPKQILRELGLGAGDLVMFRISDDDPEQLCIVPMRVAERRYARGERAERLIRLTASDDDRSLSDTASVTDAASADTTDS